MPLQNKKRVLIVSVFILLTIVAIVGAVVLISNNKSDNTENKVNEEVIDQANAVVIDDVYVESIESIKTEDKDNPANIYVRLYRSGSDKEFVEKYSEAIPYFQAAYEYAQNDEQRIDLEIRIYNSAQKSNNTELAEEYKEKLGDKLTTPTVTGSQQYVE